VETRLWRRGSSVKGAFHSAIDPGWLNICLQPARFARELSVCDCQTPMCADSTRANATQRQGNVAGVPNAPISS
jgi:hypothetical protein